MNTSIKIDSDALALQVEEMKKVNARIETILDSMKKNTEDLKDCWNSKTSNNVFDEFKEEYETFESIKQQNIKDIKFLENVIENYKSLDKSVEQNTEILNS